MVAERVEQGDIDVLISDLSDALQQVRKSRSQKQRVAREALAIRIGDTIQRELLELEDVICRERDWLDANREHPLWDGRRRAFDDELLRQHAYGNEALIDAAGVLQWRR